MQYDLIIGKDLMSQLGIILDFGENNIIWDNMLVQEKMSELMSGLEFVRVYIDDLLCITTSTFEDHLENYLNSSHAFKWQD